MFKNLEEIKEYIKMNKTFIIDEQHICVYCEGPMTDFNGSLEYFTLDLPDYTCEKFCCESCMIDYLKDNYMNEEEY